MSEQIVIEAEIGHFEFGDSDAPEAARAVPAALPVQVLPNSGTYAHRRHQLGRHGHLNLATTGHSSAEQSPEGQTSILHFPFLQLDEELRLDVDGRYPQMKASGRVSRFGLSPAHWVADLTRVAPNRYSGAIVYKEGNLTLIPHTLVDIHVLRSTFAPLALSVKFSSPGAVPRNVICRYESRYFHSVNFEFDYAAGTTPITSFDTSSHPNRPATLISEELSIERVFRRAGFDVSRSPGGPVPVSGTGVDGLWSDMEMHDAMQTNWSRFANKSQWAMWVFFASLHEMGTGLGGIMFDSIGTEQRQGTALFLDSFIKYAPTGDPAAAAWVNRMAFWTACHEMGHAFNLAHSWQKTLGASWIPLADEPLARSFMNYPYGVPGGQSAFFSDFEFRFSDQELTFMRHAPAKFVQMGNAAWFDDHGFEGAAVSPEPRLELELSTSRATRAFDFLEPLVLGLTLRNASDQPLLVDKNVLSSEHLTVIIKRRGGNARQFLPYAQRCFRAETLALLPRQELTESLFISAGRNGWDLAEPGVYMVQIALHLETEDVVSKPLEVRVAPPRAYEDELLAQDFFEDDVGRVLTFDGTRLLASANDVLDRVVSELPQSRAAIHARVALANPLTKRYKRLETEGKQVTSLAPELARAKELLAPLTAKANVARETLHPLDYAYYMDRFADVLK
jgi:hypothetical protein